ncbi:SPX domain-containing protein [Cantharellus anzutake]|uniref:SPX domain-containing protein n=1 Tax=Cantharellus anzutake TaxID=1750568 RepID=UPI0019036A11|nr:SPX domain-containing protein [Cantharellus anzutake]KAF8342720.1 SPX domain-containing protein [Cantharellus anzutake]
MKFGKTYTTLLASLPEAWRESAIEYIKLKKIIGNTVKELEEIGLDPNTLHQILHPVEEPEDPSSTQIIFQLTASKDDQAGHHLRSDENIEGNDSSVSAQRGSFVTYEPSDEHGNPSPHLRVRIAPSMVQFLEIDEEDQMLSQVTNSVVAGEGDEAPTKASTRTFRLKHGVLWALQKRYAEFCAASDSDLDNFSHADRSHAPTDPLKDEGFALTGTTQPVPSHVGRTHTLKLKEVTIQLTADTEFYGLFAAKLRSFAEHQARTQESFTNTVDSLSNDISQLPGPSSRGHSNLYAWREIFRLWVEAQIFEGTIEKDRGEHDTEEAERRLATFANATRHLEDRRSRRGKDSRAALDRFLQLNMLLLDIKKFQHANAEAARKILKKHEKRTALMLPQSTQRRMFPMLGALMADSASGPHGISLAHILLTQLTSTLLPVIPTIDDYECLICTSIAFIPIRLQCGHLFCVRCLAKMQKRQQDECPLCRSPCVGFADKSNVDLALKRFMMQWFPDEAKAKQKANERESTEEELREMGFQIPETDCIVM